MVRSRSLPFLLLLAGCSRPATSLSLALSTDARTPTELDELHLRVERAAVTTLERTWALPREAQLPGSLTLVPDDGRDPREAVLIVASGYKDGVRRVERRARLSFSDEKRKVLRLRLSYACFDVVCSPDLTCDEGRCVPPDVNVDALPDEDAVGGDGVSAGACFDERACFAGASAVPLSACSFAAPGPKGSFNLYATWAAAPDRAALVGPSAYDVAGVSGTLGEALCQAAKKKSLLALHAAPVTSACKAATTEIVCGDPPTVAGTGGGAGTAGTSGAGGAGQGGTGQGGGGQGGIDGGGAGGGGQAGAGASAGGAGASGASGAGAGGVSGASGSSGAGAGGTSGAGGVAGKGGTSGAGGLAGTGGASGAGAGGASGAGAGGTSGASGASGAGSGGAGAAGSGGAGAAGSGGAGAAGAGGASGSAGASGAGAGGASGAVGATIAVASAAACAVTPSGVACWGNDNMGQLVLSPPLGQVDLLVPQIVPATGGATSVAMAANHTCAIVAGQVTCWGSNADAESTGDGATSFSTSPVVVTPAVEVVALDGATCARDAAGSVSCWGRADDGRLGVPGTGAKGITSAGISDAVALGAGGASVACALRPALVGVGNRVTCWGNGVLAPTDIGGLDRAVEVRVGALGDVFVRRDDGTVVTSHAFAGAWSAFASVTLPGAATALSADWHLCFASADGQVRCGILGYTASNASVGAWFSIGVPAGGVSELAGGNAIQYGRGSRCARATLGGVHCFGDDRSGQLGAGRLEDELSPALVAGTASLARIDLGNFGTVAVTSGGAPLFWGSSPALGASLDSIVTTPTTPSGVPTPTTFVRMGVDDNLAYALSGGQLSLFEQGVIKPATRVGGYGPATTLAFQDVYFGSEYDAALATVDGTAKIVFYATSGALNAAQEGVFGNGGVLPATYSSLGLVGPTALTSFPQMAYTPGHLCALTGTTLQCWGGNSNTQSGVAGGAPVLTPHGITLPSVTAACAGYAHTCAISGGKVYCWGRNFEGQVGVTGASAFSDPTEIAGNLTGITGLACGHSHTCAWTLSGQLHCWGINHYGQLGIGDRAVHVGPQLVTSLSGVTYVGAAEEHTCAISAGQAYCWGLGYGGKLGNQKTGVETLAQAVVLP